MHILVLKKKQPSKGFLVKLTVSGSDAQQEGWEIASIYDRKEDGHHDLVDEELECSVGHDTTKTKHVRTEVKLEIRHVRIKYDIISVIHTSIIVMTRQW